MVTTQCAGTPAACVLALSYEVARNAQWVRSQYEGFHRRKLTRWHSFKVGDHIRSCRMFFDHHAVFAGFQDDVQAPLLLAGASLPEDIRRLIQSFVGAPRETAACIVHKTWPNGVTCTTLTMAQIKRFQLVTSPSRIDMHLGQLALQSALARLEDVFCPLTSNCEQFAHSTHGVESYQFGQSSWLALSAGVGVGGGAGGAALGSATTTVYTNVFWIFTVSNTVPLVAGGPIVWAVGGFIVFGACAFACGRAVQAWNSDAYESAVGKVLTYVNEEWWTSKMCVYFLDSADGTEPDNYVEVFGSGNRLVLPPTAFNIRVSFQVLRVGIWCSVKDAHGEAQVYEYPEPADLTFCLGGWLWNEQILSVRPGS